MLVVVEGDDTCGLRRAGHEQADVLAHLLQVRDQLTITGIEADTKAGQVRTLRQ